MGIREDAVREVVLANRILAREDVVDAYGHVSVRNPEDSNSYFLSYSRAPQLVDEGDIIEFSLDGVSVTGDKRQPYLERFIHGAIYEARPDVQAVVHAHAEDTLPFGISRTPLVPVIHSGAFIGGTVPVWDIADKFGANTNLLVTNMEQGRDLAKTLGDGRVALMRGHGFAAAANSLIDVVRLAVYMPRNARVLMKALAMGDVTPLNEGEIVQRAGGGETYSAQSLTTWRAWEYWAHRAEATHLLGEKPER